MEFQRGGHLEPEEVARNLQLLARVLRPGLVKKLNGFYFGRQLAYAPLLKATCAKIMNSSRAYQFDPPEFVLEVNKGQGVLRHILMFSPVDYLVYYYCMLSLDTIIAQYHVDGTFGGYSMGGPSRAKSPKLLQDISLEPPSAHSGTLARFAYMAEYKHYNDAVLEQMELHPSHNVLMLDIANFYDTISIDFLVQKLRRAVVAEDPSKLVALALLRRFLRGWRGAITPGFCSAVGLPQEAVGDCSRILANFYLTDYDYAIAEACRSWHGGYVRYLDDQLVFFPKSVRPEEVLYRCSAELYQQGLNLNLSKTLLFDSVEQYRRFRGYDIYANLPASNHGAKFFSPEVAERFARDFLRRDPDSLYKNGSAIIKTIISIGINKLTPETRARILHKVSFQYLEFLDQRHFEKLISALSDQQYYRRFPSGQGVELQAFLTRLDLALSAQLHNAQKYEVLRTVRGTQHEARFRKYYADI